MDGAQVADFRPAAISLKRRHRIELELRDMMAAAGIRLQDCNRGSYNGFAVSDWTWQRLAEDLAERLDRGKLG